MTIPYPSFDKIYCFSTGDASAPNDNKVWDMSDLEFGVTKIVSETDSGYFTCVSA
jgi:hypothetical protein